MACPAFDPQAYTVSVVALIDCRVEELGRDGYLALAAGGSPVLVALGGLITILVGLTGYRLLLGDHLQIRDGVLTVVRIGIVLAFATQWPAYQVVVYDLVVRGPTELTELLSGATGSSSSEIPGRIQSLYSTLETLSHPPRFQAPPQQIADPATTSPAIAPLPALPPTTLLLQEQRRVSSAAVALLISSLTGILSVRLIAALLLALGPLFIACLLFRGLSGMFEGWVRGLAGAFVGSIAVAVVLSVELAILEPQTVALVAALQAGAVPSGAVGEILATSLLFGVVMLMLLFAAVRVGAGFRLPDSAAFQHREQPTRMLTTPARMSSSTELDLQSKATFVAPSRVSQIVDALNIAEHRASGQPPALSRIPALTGKPGLDEPARAPLGQSQRRTLARRSAAAARRDRS